MKLISSDFRCYCLVEMAVSRYRCSFASIEEPCNKEIFLETIHQRYNNQCVSYEQCIRAREKMKCFTINFKTNSPTNKWIWNASSFLNLPLIHHSQKKMTKSRLRICHKANFCSFIQTIVCEWEKLMQKCI